ncbi:MAG: dipicolinate synthase subunit B [Caldicoprobacterales bacterium]|jgi:dipicolinate synthase subunit B|nr:dipicolinate synthase subunit B [Clostridiales bacterium]
MSFSGLKIGFCICGSFCTFDQVIPELKKLVAKGADVTPIFSEAAYSWDTKFYSAKEFRSIVEGITGKQAIKSVVEAEPIGPGKILDIIIVAPCTGNTMAKLANGITDSPVTMACKAHLRNQRPVVIAIATNDGLGANAKNIGILLNMKNVFFTPFGQDDPTNKNNSLVAKFELLIPTVEKALKGEQIQPVLA